MRNVPRLDRIPDPSKEGAGQLHCQQQQHHVVQMSQAVQEATRVDSLLIKIPKPTCSWKWGLCLTHCWSRFSSFISWILFSAQYALQQYQQNSDDWRQTEAGIWSEKWTEKTVFENWDFFSSTDIDFKSSYKSFTNYRNAKLAIKHNCDVWTCSFRQKKSNAGQDLKRHLKYKCFDV